VKKRKSDKRGVCSQWKISFKKNWVSPKKKIGNWKKTSRLAIGVSPERVMKSTRKGAKGDSKNPYGNEWDWKGTTCDLGVVCQKFQAKKKFLYCGLEEPMGKKELGFSKSVDLSTPIVKSCTA